MLAMLTAIAANAWSVKFTNPDNWATVYVWAWDNSTNYTGGNWPGKQMTKQGSVWVYEDNSTSNSPTQIIFSNGNGSQTNDLNFQNGATYDKNGVVGAVITYIDIYVPYYLYKGDNAYIYSWEPSIFGGWPGATLTKVTKNGIDFWTTKLDDTNVGKNLANWKLSGSLGETQNYTSTNTIQADYVYEFNGTATPLAEYKLPDDISDKITYEIRGTIFGNPSWADYAMTESDGKWSYTGTAVAGDFGIKQMTNGTQTAWYSADGKNTISEPGVYNCKVNGTNFSNQLEGEVTFTFDPEALTLTVTGGQVVEIDYTTWYLNVLGDFNDWIDNGEALNADGVGTLSDLEIGDGGFKLKVWNGSDMWLSTGSAMLAGKTYSITGNSDNNMTIADAKAGYKYNVTYDAVNQTIKVDWAGEPLEVFIIGELKDKYEAGDEIRFGTNYPDEATIYFTFGDEIEIPDFGAVEVPADQPAAAPRKVTSAVDYSTTGLNVYNPSQPIVFQDAALELNYVAYSKAMGASAGQRLVIGSNGETTGIENVAVDNNAPVEYFNLQGVRVANPSNGVFIRRQGNTASKVYVK